MAEKAEAACILDGNHLGLARESAIPSGRVRAISRTKPYDHCWRTVLDDVDRAVVDRFVSLLLAMSFDGPRVRPLLALEGLKQWRSGRTSGYEELEAADDRRGFYGPDGALLAEGAGG